MIDTGRSAKYRLAENLLLAIATTSRDANSKDSEPSSKDNGGNSKDSEFGLSRNHDITGNIQQQLERIARPVAAKWRVRPIERDATIIQRCQLVPLSANQIAKLLGRDILYIRQQILPQLIAKGLLKSVCAETPNHLGQRYLAPDRGYDDHAE